MSIERYRFYSCGVSHIQKEIASDGAHVSYADHQAEIAELTKRLEAAELNAARYEWLRDPEQHKEECEDDVLVCVCDLEDILWAEELDMAIDTRLAQGESNGD